LINNLLSLVSQFFKLNGYPNYFPLNYIVIAKKIN
jgi:hypothetical protein